MSSKHINPKNDEVEKMVMRSVYFELSIWQQAMSKAKRTGIPLAIIIRKLVKDWLAGKITITINDETKL